MAFGNWNSIYIRFNEWSLKDKLMPIFKCLIGDKANFEWKFIDGSIVKAHQHSSGAAKGQETAIGKSVAGNTTKIHMVVESHGFPVEFKITGGQVHDCMVAPELVLEIPAGGYTVADKGYDSEPLREMVKDLESIPVIPRKCNSKTGNDDVDWELYKFRHLVENIFARLKHFRSVATRYDKLKKIYEGTLALACGYVWLIA